MELTKESVIKNSLVGALINGAINAGISASSFFKQQAVPLSLDNISNEEVTVFGEGVLLAFMLTLILTGVQYAMVAKQMRKSGDQQAFPYRFWTWGVRVALRNALTVFGAAMAAAVLWQRFIGTVMVSPLAATLVMFALAFAFTVYANVTTTNAMLAARENAPLAAST